MADPASRSNPSRAPGDCKSQHGGLSCSSRAAAQRRKFAEAGRRTATTVRTPRAGYRGTCDLRWVRCCRWPALEDAARAEVLGHEPTPAPGSVPEATAHAVERREAPPAGPLDPDPTGPPRLPPCKAPAISGITSYIPAGRLGACRAIPPNADQYPIRAAMGDTSEITSTSSRDNRAYARHIATSAMESHVP